jgi:exonuclease VII small subunit
MAKNKKKLKKLLEHWAEHNDSHKESFEKWQKIADELGLESVVGKLGKAIEMINQCNKYLLSAREDID